MKRCPECRRDYRDDSLLYCLDDGARLVEGPGSADAPTEIYREVAKSSARPVSSRWKALVLAGVGVLAVGIIGYLIFARTPAVKPGPSPAAYDNFMKAKVLVASENKTDVDSAIDLLKQSVTDDPQYAPAWALLARAEGIKAFYFAADNERKPLTDDAQVAVEKALAIDPELAEAHFARGLLLWTHANRFPHEQAIQAYKRAIALNPNLDEAHHQLGIIYFHLGLFDKATAETTKALEINPGNTLARFRLGAIELYRGKYDEAYEFFKSTPLEKNPSLYVFQTALALFKLGKTDEANQMVDQYLREYPSDEGGAVTSLKAMLLAKAGKTTEAQEAIDRAVEIGRNFGHFHHTAYNIALAYVLLHEADKAVDYLQLAADDGFPCYPLFDGDEGLKDLRQNPRFIALLSKLKQQWERYNSTL